jgi:hypothetical protein
MSNQVAETILNQLGGASRFTVMTGAKNFVYGTNYLKFQLSRPQRIVTVTLDPTDTYTMEFSTPVKFDRRTLTIKDGKVLFSLDHLHAGQLQRVFTEQTGLHTHL